MHTLDDLMQLIHVILRTIVTLRLHSTLVKLLALVKANPISSRWHCFCAIPRIKAGLNPKRKFRNPSHRTTDAVCLEGKVICHRYLTSTISAIINYFRQNKQIVLYCRSLKFLNIDDSLLDCL